MNVKLERIEHSLGRIILSNPPGNSLDRPDFMDPGELEAFLEDKELKGVIISGSGRHFCAGADLSALRRQQYDGEAFLASLHRGKRLIELINRATVPVLAAIRGSCLGAGLELALACHFRFGTGTSLYGFPETQHGFMPGLGGTVMAPDLLKTGGVIDLVLSGRCVLGEAALQRGILDRLVENSDLERTAISYLVELTDRNSPMLIRHALASIHDGRFLPRNDALEHETRRFFELIQETRLDD